MRTPQLILFCQNQADLALKKAQSDRAERNQVFFNSKAETFKKIAVVLTDSTVSTSEYVKALSATAAKERDAKAPLDILGFDSCNAVVIACDEVRKVW